jgi:hypothetical protein
MRLLSLVVIMGLLIAALQTTPAMVIPVPGIELTPEEKRVFRERLAACEARIKAVEDLLIGQRTVTDTAEQFRMIAVRQDLMHYLRVLCPGCSDNQSIHRQILWYTEHWLVTRHLDLSPLEELRKKIEILEQNDSTSLESDQVTVLLTN